MTYNNLDIKAKEEFRKRFSSNPLILASPGRINIIGEHTDYNGGYVFPAAINKYVVGAIAKNNLDYCRVYAIDIDETFEFHLNSIEKCESGSWKNYIAGVVFYILELNKTIGNFDLALTSDIPIGAGLSSSAALENCIAYGLNKVFDIGLSNEEIMNISIKAEHEFANVKCGMMDQFANLNGVENHALLLNCENLSFEKIPIELNKYKLLLINTNVKHQLSDSPYNERKNQCKKGFETLKDKFPQLNVLSNASLKQLESIRHKLNKTEFNRCKYVIEENTRVTDAKKAIKNNNIEALGNLLFASHNGLSKQYEVSCKELDFIVDIAHNTEGVIGSRMMGGGFGGCTINLTHKDSIDSFISSVEEKYFEKFNSSISHYLVDIVDGTHTISHGQYIQQIS